MEINLNQLTEDLKKLEIVKRLTESEKEKFGDISQEEISKYLNELRKSGVTNMFGATPYIEKEFGISKEDARKALSYWMKNFKKDESKKRPKKVVCPKCDGYGDTPEGRDPCDTCKGKGTVNESKVNEKKEYKVEKVSNGWQAITYVNGKKVDQSFTFKTEGEADTAKYNMEMRKGKRFKDPGYYVYDSKVNENLVDALDEIEGRLGDSREWERDVLEAFELAGVNNFVDLVREDEGAAEALVICYAGKNESKINESDFDTQLKRYKKEAYDYYANHTQLVPTPEEILNYICDQVEDASGVEVDDATAKMYAKKLGLTLDEHCGHCAEDMKKKAKKVVKSVKKIK